MRRRHLTLHRPHHLGLNCLYIYDVRVLCLVKARFSKVNLVSVTFYSGTNNLSRLQSFICTPGRGTLKLSSVLRV